MIKRITTLSTILAIFVFYIVMQNYQPSDKQSFVIAIIEQDNKFLLEKNEQAQVWQFINGLVQPKETVHAALAGLIETKLNSDSTVGTYLGTHKFNLPNQTIELHAFKMDNLSPKLIIQNSSNHYQWFEKSKLKQIKIEPTQLFVIENLQKTS